MLEAPRPHSGRLLNIVIGAGVASAAGLALSRHYDEPLRAAASILGLLAGLLIAIRKPAKADGTIGMLAVALPSVIVGSALASRANGISEIPTAAWVFVALGGILSVWAIGTLGRAFAIFPAVRDVIVRGPFRWIRHPAYAGQLLMLVGCVIAVGAGPVDIGLLLLAAICIGARAVAEERLLLSADAAYTEYAARVRWRVVPGIW